MFRWLLPLAGIGLIAVLAVAGWLRTMPVESTLAMQKDTVVIVTQVPVPPAMPADSAWLKFEHRAETAYTNAYLMAKDSLANMVPRDYYAAYTIFNNYAVNVYYLREQFVASNPEYEEQFMEHYVRIYERDYTRLYRILVRDFPYSQE